MATMIEGAGTKPASVRTTPDAARRAALTILIVAVIVGAGLRFYRLGAEEMSRGEAAAWTAAVAPDLRSVFLASKQLDPGKSGVYDLVLHLWIDVFGDAVGPLRTLSALLGTLAILLIFAAVREIFRVLDDDSVPAVAWNAAAFTALLYACNLQMITIDRTARMYPLMLVAVFGQLWGFARAQRCPGAGTVVVTALFTDLAVAANFTSLFLFMAEALWLAGRWVSLRRKIDLEKGGPELSVWRPALALLLAGLLYWPIGISDAQHAVSGLHAGVWSSIEPRPPWWPIRALQVMTGNAAFWPTLILAIFGIWRSLHQGRVIGFMLCWMLVPFALLELVSYLITPMMVERYALVSLAAYLALTAVGLARLPNGSLRYLLAAVVIAQSLAHVHHHWRTPDDVQWREAVRFAVAAAPTGTKIAVMPPEEPLLVLKYYLPPSEHPRLVGVDAKLDPSRHWQMRCGREPLLIASTELPAESRPPLEACYPRLLKRFRLVEVRAH